MAAAARGTWRWRREHYAISHFSRFFRDGHGALWSDVLADTVLHDAARRAGEEGRHVRCWSVGCACGEEAYSVRMAWDTVLRPNVAGAPPLEVVGTDRASDVVALAELGVYPEAALRDVPEDVRRKCFEDADVGAFRAAVLKARCPTQAGAPSPKFFRLRDAYRDGVSFETQDILDVGRLFNDAVRRGGSGGADAGDFDVILCRYSLFLYLPSELRARALHHLVARLRPGGFLVLGRKGTETLPANAPAARLLQKAPDGVGNVYRRLASADDASPWPSDTLAAHVRRKHEEAMRRDMETLRAGLQGCDGAAPYAPVKWCVRLHSGKAAAPHSAGAMPAAPRAWLSLAETLRQTRADREAASAALAAANAARASELAQRKRRTDRTCVQRRIASARARARALPGADAPPGESPSWVQRMALFEAERDAKLREREQREEARVRALLCERKPRRARPRSAR